MKKSNGERVKMYLLLFISTPALFQVIAQDAPVQSVSIKAFLPYWHHALVQLSIDGKKVHTDSIHNDIYSYTGKIEGIKQATLEIKRKNVTTYLSLFIEPGIIKIRDEGQSLVAYGTPLNNAFFQLNQSFDSLALLQKNLRFGELKQYKRRLAETYIQHHSSSPISLKLLDDYFFLDNEANDTVYHSLFHSLDDILKNSYPAKKILEEVTKRYATANGRKAPLLQLPNLENKLSFLYETGNYTLINFWASWCVPCKKEFIALAEIHAEHESNQLTIVSVSLDKNKIIWTNAVQKAKLPWKQLSDLKGWYRGVAYTFGVKAIPNNFLLDKNGIIIGKNLSTEQLKKLLNQIFLMNK